MKKKAANVHFVFRGQSYDVTTDAYTAKNIGLYNKIYETKCNPNFYTIVDDNGIRNIRAIRATCKEFDVVCIKSKIGRIPDDLQIANNLHYYCALREQNGATHKFGRDAVAMMIYETLAQRAQQK